MHDHHLVAPITALDFSGIMTMLSFSFFSSFHCAFMCGPLLGCMIEKKSWRNLTYYNLARGFSYVCLGAVLGFCSASLREASFALGKILSICLGLSLIFFATQQNIYPKGQWLASLLKSFPPKWRTTLLGLTTVFLPCMTLTPALASALASQSPQAGSLLMLSFFLGTLPMMLASSWILDLIKPRFQMQASILGKMFLLLTGVISILRVLH